MELGKSGDELRLVVVVVGEEKFDPLPSPSTLLCKICHEEEDENSTSMESPCACSGTLKFAHRRCIQRWCDEKGSTVCEICLQKFEPGYTVPPKLALLDIAVTIRGSLEVPRLNYESQNTGLIDEESDNDYPGCSPPSHPSAALFRTIALIFMVLILARHLIIVLATGEGNYPFAAATVLLLRASGIFLPFYCIMRIIAAIQKKQQQHLYRTHRRDASAIQRVEEGELQQHVIQIHS